MAAVGNARPRGRGRVQGGGQIRRLPGGGLPRGAETLPLRIPPGQAGPLRQKLGMGGNGNGGTAAPPAPGQRVNPPGRGMMNPPGQSNPSRPARGRGAQGKGQGADNGKGIGVGGAALPGPGGRQLAARVSSGKITQEQADRTMKQRQTLAKAFGPNWRDQLKVGGQSFASVRQGLKKNPGNAKLAAINKKLLEGRKKALEAARKKTAGGGKAGDEGQE